jgi:biofilm PGA synthesis N-glycosyltransferase PgaC
MDEKKIKPGRSFYFSVFLKFCVMLFVSLLWAIFSYLVAQRWIDDLSVLIGRVAAHVIIFGIAIIPGWMNAFLLMGLLLDRRPPKTKIEKYPPLSILVAAYNEEQSIVSTIESIAKQDYPGGGCR